MNREELDYRVKFCQKYFGKSGWKVETLNRVDVLLHDRRERPLLYIESKERINCDGEERRKAIAQILLTNKRQEIPLGRVAILYFDIKHERDMLEVIDCSDNSVMMCPEVKWDVETPSSPTDEAVYHLNNRVTGRITSFKGEDEIRDFAKEFKKSGKSVCISITAKNCILIYNQWKAEVKFSRERIQEQTLIDLFLADMINNEKYTVKQRDDFFEKPLEREGTNLGLYNVQPSGIAYRDEWYGFVSREAHDEFWRRYHRPPIYDELLKIKEHSNELYSEGYRKSTGHEYTPSAFVRLQNELIARYYDINQFIVFDPCAGVGNLQNQFGRDYKEHCYLSTLLEGDVDQCKLKDFRNAVVFDYMKDKQQPKFQYKGQSNEMAIDEIAQAEDRKLMVIMNPPYVKAPKGKRYDLCIEFFRKVLDVSPDVIVLYCKTEFFFRKETCNVFANSGYKIREHVISNAKTTFKISEWPISLVIFDREQGEDVSLQHTSVKRYEQEKKTGRMELKGHYDYDHSRPKLIDECEAALRDRAHGLLLGQWTNDRYCIILSNRHTHEQYVTTQNLRLALMLKGINFNTHPHYFETRDYIFRGHVSDIGTELINDAIIHALFYKGNNFSNKEGVPNYLMPFTAQELGCGRNQLNVLFPTNDYQIPFPNGEEDICPFDFREWMQEMEMSQEAKAVYDAALVIARYYHNEDAYSEGRNWNDSFYDIKNAIMGKDATDYQNSSRENDRRLTKVKIAKGVLGFSQSNVRKVVSEEHWPMFDCFFVALKKLSEKIIRQMVEANLLLWKPENVY